ncbi:hypothetical protein ACFX11_040505 [Malus domestica]
MGCGGIMRKPLPPPLSLCDPATLRDPSDTSLRHHAAPSHHLLTRSAIPLSASPFSTDLAATAPAGSTFSDAWKKAVPHIEPPKTLLTFMKASACNPVVDPH